MEPESEYVPMWDDPQYRFLVTTGGGWYYTQVYKSIPSEWMKEHLSGDWCNYGPVYYFEKESDLTLFTLTWC